jgi:hypothetical protein
MLVYTKTHAVAPNFLFTGGTVTRVIVMLPTFLRHTSFLSLYIGHENGLHEGHTLFAPKLLLGLLGLKGLTCFCCEGLPLLS